MRARLVLFVLAVILLAGSGVGAQVPPPPPGQLQPGVAQAAQREVPAKKTATGVMRGRVLAADTGAPLRRARVSFTAVESNDRRTMFTDLDGRFEFKSLSAGHYSVTASKTGYVRLEYGQRRPREAGRPVALADAQELEKVDFALPKAAAVSGRVFDDLGEPSDQALVVAMRMQYYQGSRQLVIASNPVRADDIGQYRIFGLPPGSYYIATMTLGTSGTGGDQLPVFAKTYYPGTPSAADAQAIVLKVGEERLNVDIALAAGRASKVSGVALDARGGPLVNPTVSSSQSVTGPSGGAFSAGQMATVAADGSFTLKNMPPGEHTLSARGKDAQTGEDLVTRPTTVMLTGQDVSGLVLTASPVVSMSGRVRTDPAVAPPFAPADIKVLPSMPSLRFSSVVRNDWTFEMKGVMPGLQKPSVDGLPAAWTLKAVIYGGRDVADTGIDVKGTEDVTGVDVVLTNVVTEINGSVMDDQSKPVSDYTVVAFPEDSNRWKEKSRFMAQVRPDQSGRFTVRALPPGRYFVVAVEYLDEGDAYDPELLEKLRPHATAVTLKDTSPQTLTLKVVVQ
jgi:hypothetical protein